MAEIKIIIADDNLSDVLDAFDIEFNYEQNKKVSETKQQFAKRMVIKNIKKIVSNHLSNRAAELARIAAANVDNIDIT